MDSSAKKPVGAQPQGGGADDGIPAADPAHGSSQDANVASLEAKVKELTEQVTRLTDIAARAQADLQNAKQRMQRDGDDLRRFAAESLIRRLLPVIDNLRRAASHLPSELAGHEWVKGILAIEQDLLRQLSEMGLKRMEPMGQQVDTAKHEVLLVEAGEEGVILDVLEDGYELGGKVIRPAKVKVGGGGEK